MKNKLLLTLIGCCLMVFSGYAQASKNYKSLAKEKNANYYDIVRQAKEEFASKDLTTLVNKKAFKQFNRWAYYWEDRVNLDGTFPNENTGFYNAGVLTKEGKLITQNNRTRNRSAQTWINVGPQQSELNNNGYSNYPQMGRLNAFLRIPHPSDATQDVLFAGAPNGGIWKSTDGGANWTPKLDMVAGIGVTDIKTVPGTTTANYTTRPIYVSTGDYDGSHVKSIGVLKSTDGGENFVSTGLSYSIDENKILGDLIVIDANTVFVGDDNKIKKTINGGTSWTDAFSSSFSNVFMGRAAINGNEIMYVDAYDVHYTADYTNDSNWSTVSSGNNQDKKAVTVDHNGDFYIQAQNGQVKKFDKGNNTFSDVGNIPAGYNSQGGYNQALIVDASRIISGEFNGQTSSDDGANWYRSLNGYWFNSSSPGSYIHSDHHRMGKLATNKYWSVNDGGLSYIDYSSDAQKPTITYLSGKVKVTQSYSVAINPNANDGAYVIANQDNDAMSKTSGTWYAVAMGDGIQSAVNYTNTNIRYAGNQSGIIIKTDTGFNGQLQGNGSNVQIPGASFYFPLEMHKTNPTILYGGGSDVFKLDGSSGLTISSTSSGLSGVKTIATHGDAVMAATTSAAKFSSDQAGSWSSVSIPSDASGNITSVDFSSTDNNTIYMSFSGYNNGKKVYKTTDGGTNWTNISGNLPNVVTREVILKQGEATETLFLATELGVYYTTNGGTNWSKLGQGLPNVDIRDIEIHYTADKLVAASFGRGLWEINIEPSTLGTESVNNELTGIAMYPNPVKDSLVIKSSSNSNLKYVIYNVVGGMVKSGVISSTPINVSSLARGVYIVRIVDGKKSTSRKLIVE